MTKLIVTFIVTISLSYSFIKLSLKELSQRQAEIGAVESRIIHNAIKDRFNLSLNLHLAVGLLSADNLAKRGLTYIEYGVFAKKILDYNKEILGINLLNSEGVITHVFPENANQAAKNLVSQNLSSLEESYLKKEDFWLSHPFDLYQGQLGFAFYTPIIRDKRLHGWVATVISAKTFFDEFQNYDFFKDYELIIRDKLTDSTYFATSALENISSKIFDTTSAIRGRELVFQSWRKKDALSFDYPWYWIFLGSISLASLLTFGVHLHDQRKKAREDLQNISILLGLTAKEAISNLVDIHSEINKLGETGYVRTSVVSKDVVYITNLIEQIDLLQTMANNSNDMKLENFKPLDLMRAQLEDLKEISFKKGLNISIETENLKDIVLFGSSWLFQNGILRNALTYSIIMAHDGGKIKIDHSMMGNNHHIVFIIDEVYQDADKHEHFKLDRRLDVTKNVLKLFHGQLFMYKTMETGLTVKIVVPAKKTNSVFT